MEHYDQPSDSGARRDPLDGQRESFSAHAAADDI